jgi:hypothetical protein
LGRMTWLLPGEGRRKWIMQRYWSGRGIYMQMLHSFSDFIKVFIFNWKIIDLQYCVGFCHTSTWINHRYTYVPSLLRAFNVFVVFLEGHGRKGGKFCG